MVMVLTATDASRNAKTILGASLAEESTSQLAVELQYLLEIAAVNLLLTCSPEPNVDYDTSRR